MKIKKWLTGLLVFCLIMTAVPIQGATSLPIRYSGKNYNYTDKQLKVKCNNKNVDISDTPGILDGDIGLLPYEEVFQDALNVSTTYSEAEKSLTLSKNGNKVILYVDGTYALVNGKKVQVPAKAKFVLYRNVNETKLLVPSRFVSKYLGFDYVYTSSTATISIVDNTSSSNSNKQSLAIVYAGKKQNYTDTQYTVYAEGKKVSTVMPAIKKNDTILVPAYTTFAKGGQGIQYSYKNSKMTLTKGDQSIIMKKGSKTALINGEEITLTEPLRAVKKVANGKYYMMAPVEVIAEAFGLVLTVDEELGTVKLTVPVEEVPDVEEPDVPEEDQEEMKGMWVSYLELGSGKKTEAQWKKKIDSIIEDCVNYGMNTIIFQVRPFGDAIYESDLFPWSQYVSGTQGVDPGYDPFEYVVEASHKKGLKVEAWINPYRVSSSSTDITKLSKDNPARTFRSTKGKERYVLAYNNGLYYNPAVKEVQNLIVNGVKEILDKYDVDGIHLDDYFYPSLGSNYANSFDATEYKASGSKLSIANWRRENVNTLVKKLYSTVKAADPNIRFGISPAGNINNLKSNTAYYVDIDTWLSEKGYVDYICPQIYWSFDHKTAAYDKMVDQWIQLNKSDIVDLYIGIAVYKAGDRTVDSGEWGKKSTILRDQILYGRETGKVDGYMFFRYDSFHNSVAQKEVNNLLKVLKQ